MTISTNGTFINNQSGTTGQASSTYTLTATGDLLVAWIIVEASTISVSGVTSGGADGNGWHQLATPVGNSTVGFTLDGWYCVTGSTGSVTMSMTFSASIGTNKVQVSAQEYTAGSNITWALDGTPSIAAVTTSSTTPAYPTLTAANSGELYSGCVVPQNTASAGSSSGFTYQVDNVSDAIAWNVNVSSGSVSATCNQSPTGQYIQGGALFKATSSGLSSLLNPPAPNRTRLTTASY